MALNYKLMGIQIQFHRNERGLTQEKLAERIGRSISFLSSIENGRSIPSLETVVNITNALHVSMDALLKDSLNISPALISHEIDGLLSNREPWQAGVAGDLVKQLMQSLDDRLPKPEGD